jgi:DNA-directed RNA polymerase subunit alpha
LERYYKKVLSKIDLSSPIDKPDQQDSTMFSSGNHKIGYFTIDATFMPVTRVNYLIQASDDLQLAKDYIILEVWTNGSIHPRHAIHKAAKALIQLFLPLQQMKNWLKFRWQVQLKSRQSKMIILLQIKFNEFYF